jgi:hypothetical protein
MSSQAVLLPQKMDSSLQLFKQSGVSFKQGVPFDWQKNLYLPLETRRAVFAPGHQRWKRENFNCKVYTAWDEKSLYLAFAVRARAPQNLAADNALWNSDCLEIMLDVREKPTAAYEKNTMHLCIAPPGGKYPGRYMFSDGTTQAPGFEIKSFLTDEGWAGTAVIPWSAFDNFMHENGTEIGLGILVGDAYGRENNNLFFAAQYLCFGSKDIPRDATTLPRWRLVEKFAPSEENDLSNLMAVDFQKLLMSDCIDAPVVICEPFKEQVKSIDWRCEINGIILQGSCKPERLQINLPADCFGKGCVYLTVRNSSNEVLGCMQLPFDRIDLSRVKNTEKAFFELLQKYDLSKLAQDSPGTLTAIFGLLNNYEQLKRLLFVEDISEIDELLEEMHLRMQVIQNKEITTTNPLFSLLKISSGNTGQLSVEYPRCHPNNRRRNNCVIRFHAGSIPLARVSSTVVKTPAGKTSRRKIAALYRRDYFPAEKRDDLLFRAVVGGSFKQTHLLELSALEGLEGISAVVIADNAPQSHAAAVRNYADKYKLPIVNESDLQNGQVVLYAGRPAADSAMNKNVLLAYNYYRCRKGRYNLELITADGVQHRINCISYAGCELIADVLQGKRAFTAADNLKLTELVAAELLAMGIKPSPIPENVDLVAADVHCHTIYSDGVATPLALLAAAIYGQMDFLMISDHETAEGVLNTVQQLQQYQWNFPLLCGEENSLPDGHFNSYPVTKTIPAGMTLEKVIAAAHAQGALVQYNHPATYSNRRDLQLKGIANSGLEAWEHQLPGYAAGWAEQPALIGSSDNHNSSFPLERTVTLLDNITGKTFQNAVRQKRTGILSAASEGFVYGPEEIRGAVLTALLDPERYLNAPWRKRMQKYMLNSRISELYSSIPGATPAEMGK